MTMGFDSSHKQTQRQFNTQQRRSWRRAVVVLRAATIALFVLVIAAALLVGYTAKFGTIGSGVQTAIERDVVAARMEVSRAENVATADTANKSAEADLLIARAQLVLARAAAGEDASREADVLVAEEPKNPLMLFAASKAYAASDRSEQAPDFLKRAAEVVAPQAGELARMIYGDYSTLLTSRKDYKAAMDFAKKATFVKPVSVDSLFNLAAAAENQGDYYELASAYVRILNISPKNTEALSALTTLEKTHPEIVARAKVDFPQAVDSR